MIVKEIIIIDGKEFTYQKSDSNFYIEGGEPHDLYEDALDPIEFHREYVETNIPIPKEPEEIEED